MAKHLKRNREQTIEKEEKKFSSLDYSQTYETINQENKVEYVVKEQIKDEKVVDMNLERECENCNAKFKGSFCPNCGQAVKKEGLKECPKCHTQVKESECSCSACGYNFDKVTNKLKLENGFITKVKNYIKNHKKIVWGGVSAILVIVLIVSLVVGLSSNNFIIGKLSKVYIGDSEEQILKVLGTPTDISESGNTWYYYEGKYKSLIEKQKKLSESDYSESLEEESKIQEEMNTLVHNKLEVNFDNKKLSSMYLNKKAVDDESLAAQDEKVVKYVKLSKSQIGWCNNISDANLTYRAKYEDGSYSLNSIRTINNTELFTTKGDKTLNFNDKFGNISAQVYVKSSPIIVSTDGTTVKGIESSYNPTSVIIPEGVKTIDSKAFSNCSSLTSVTIPNGVTSIGLSAFSGCSSLTNIEIPDSVMTIGDSSFYNCSSLANITIPESVTLMGSSAFKGCSSLRTIRISNGIKSIKSSAFEGCSSLTNITIGNSVTIIESRAFEGCSSLPSITIPNSVTSIKDGAFNNCSSLIIILVGEKNLVYKGEENCLIEKASNTMILGCKTSIIPNYVTIIGDNAFNNCSGIESITIPDTVTSIGSSAFNDCSSLTSVTIPDSVTSIGSNAFNGCSSLTSVTIPNSVTSMGNSTFSKCSNLTDIIIGNRVTIIGRFAFNCCSKLTNITIGNSVTSIGYNAFNNCTGLEEIVIPNSVTSVEGDAFYNCSSLTSITIPNSVTSIGDNAFYGCSNMTSMTIGDSVTSIGVGAFYNCSSLTEITIPDSVTSIGDCAFYNCSNLTNVIIGNSVTTIGYWAFFGCSGLTSITIPSCVINIGGGVFKNCTNLLSITFEDSIGWYLTGLRENAINKQNGTSVDLSTSSVNATYFKETYQKKYWYKVD